MYEKLKSEVVVKSFDVGTYRFQQSIPYNVTNKDVQLSEWVNFARNWFGHVEPMSALSMFFVNILEASVFSNSDNVLDSNLIVIIGHILFAVKAGVKSSNLRLS